MLELRNYFTKYLVVVKAKKEEQRKERGVLESQQDYLNYLQGYGYNKEEFTKERSKERPEKKRKGLHYLLDKNNYIEFTLKYNVGIWRNQTKG